MAATRSRSPRKGKDTAPEDAPAAVTQEASSTVATVNNKGKQMSDISSIIEFSEDISTAEAPEPLPESDYPAEIRAAVRKTSNTSGKDYAQVQFFIAPEAYPADFTDGNPDGMLMTYNRLSLEDTPAARHRIRKFCEAVGAPSPTTKLDLNTWVGCTGTLSVGISEWEGEKRNEVKKVVAP